MSDIQIHEQSNLIWSIADKGLRNTYKRGLYAHYIVPLVILKRFDSVLQDTKETVLRTNEKLSSTTVPEIKEEILREASGYNFYNTSKYNLNRIMDDPDNLRFNMIDYIRGFSPNVRNIMENPDGLNLIAKITSMDEKKILYTVLDALNDPKINLHPSVVTNRDMGYIFEEIIRRFSEASNDDAGEHYTPREVIQLMTELLFSDVDLTKPMDLTIYDPACGTGGMLSVAEETIRDYNKDSHVVCFGQELNDETYAICVADMLIKGQDEKNVFCKNTLKEDQFVGMTFDYILCNPPFGVDWSDWKSDVEAEKKLGDLGRFAAGLPPVSDGQMLFLQTAIKKMKSPEDGGGKVAIVHGSSPFFLGDADSGPSNIRKAILENDLLDAIIALPSNIFYNTGIPTYVWILNNVKPDEHKGKVMLINAHELFTKRKKSLGNKRNDISKEQIDLIVKAYGEYKDGIFGEGEKNCEVKIVHASEFCYLKVGIIAPKIDDKGKPVLDKKGKYVYDKAKNDVENIPIGITTVSPNRDLTTDSEMKQVIEEYLDREVRPFVPYAEVDPKKKISVGYEIPFTRYFYKIMPPRPSDAIIEEIVKLNKESEQLMHDLLQIDYKQL